MLRQSRLAAASETSCGFADSSAPDDGAAQEGYLRVVDESGEDYLYPESYFVLVDLPQKAQDALLAKV